MNISRLARDLIEIGYPEPNGQWRILIVTKCQDDVYEDLEEYLVDLAASYGGGYSNSKHSDGVIRVEVLFPTKADSEQFMADTEGTVYFRGAPYTLGYMRKYP